MRVVDLAIFVMWDQSSRKINGIVVLVHNTFHPPSIESAQVVKRANSSISPRGGDEGAIVSLIIVPCPGIIRRAIACSLVISADDIRRVGGPFVHE